MNWFELFRYQEGKLYWKVQPRNNVYIGDEAGCINNKGHLQVRYKSKYYMIHRIIWEMAEGPIPDGYEIDHRNGIRDDNRIDNLRLATGSQNQWNRCKQKNNTSGFKGVYWNNPTQKWLAQITVFGKTKHLGYFSTKEEAYQSRLDAEKFYHGEYVPTEERRKVVYA